MRCLVTGAAGFIGSHLCEALLLEGNSVVGIDSFVPYYPRSVKERNIGDLRTHLCFAFYECDLRTDSLAPLMDGVEVVFHLAAMPGLLLSWTNFDLYMTCNILATQRLLEAARASGTVREFLYASTSSIYGRDVIGPETTMPQPASPYGITKLAAEHLIRTYHEQFALPTSILRYFSVYGPRQRPDMGYTIFIDNILHGRPITIFGDGNQSRGNTYVSDIVRATILAHQHFHSGTTYNIGGSEEVSANQVVCLLEEIIGMEAVIQHTPARPGEQQRALAHTALAQERLGFMPHVPLREGLMAQVAWQRRQMGSPA